MFRRQDIEALGEKLLDLTHCAVPRYRILRDVLQLPPSDRLCVEAQGNLTQDGWVRELRSSQHPDGTWGRFHSRDSALKAHFPTTEIAISRALALGLDKDSDILQKSIAYMLAVLQGKATWSDPPEKHEGWPASVRFITAGTLAAIDDRQPAIQPFCRKWIEIVERTFQSGVYNHDDEGQVHFELNGVVTRDKFLKLASRSPLMLLSSAREGLSNEMEKLFLEWVWNKEGGIYYVCGLHMNSLPALTSREFCSWLEGLEILARFGAWHKHMWPTLDWIWSQRGPDGLWDLGPAARTSIYFPLSESWHNPLDRKVDGSVRILALLRRFVG
ncbi:MAG TPA: hypothetical protein VMC62_06265 [Longilinea sp.]|nr:hypothetical protein [Longilinea sp.]